MNRFIPAVHAAASDKALLAAVLAAGFRWDTETFNTYVRGEIHVLVVPDEGLRIAHKSDRWEVRLSPKTPPQIITAVLSQAAARAYPTYTVNGLQVDLMDFIGNHIPTDDDFVAIMALEPDEEHALATQTVVRRVL